MFKLSMKSKRLLFLASLAVVLIAAGSAWPQGDGTKPGHTPAYPLKKSANGRYLVDQNGLPFLIAGESPQALMVNRSESEAELFVTNRLSHVAAFIPQSTDHLLQRRARACSRRLATMATAMETGCGAGDGYGVEVKLTERYWSRTR